MIVQFFDPSDTLSFEMPLAAIDDRLCGKLRRNFYFGGYCKVNNEIVNTVERLKSLCDQFNQDYPAAAYDSLSLSLQEQVNILAALSVMQELLLSGELPKFSRQHAISGIEMLSPAKCQALIGRLARSKLSLSPPREMAANRA